MVAITADNTYLAPKVSLQLGFSLFKVQKAVFADQGQGTLDHKQQESKGHRDGVPEEGRRGVEAERSEHSDGDNHEQAKTA